MPPGYMDLQYMLYNVVGTMFKSLVGVIIGCCLMFGDIYLILLLV
ncbi:19834_t:CDS:2 [Gigaspora rosea]|nr:19834_t:CDS:2 [Gigaspora rosea]